MYFGSIVQLIQSQSHIIMYIGQGIWKYYKDCENNTWKAETKRVEIEVDTAR